ncbi:uncharacterized protein LAESUDRAFT_664964 [Laetiporus sulphureus 93-53]|uniref:SHSP domain-containing protein n=1 Tax=Laetiporus sulphureus 93-53 TaxID=1314785 RepID=A0A165BFC6_9APHY|nr:uncharacterized protein LAESUDRAFT_664964 [Laetiporus sulphureus 93-53]KZT00936.1 hypothetical protein LAESUDRAFT_664964 [Laetiporus sulphureus 93-53]
MTFTATPFEYVFSAPLWEGLSAEMITAYAKRGDRLAVTVDAWHQEKDSHCEWEISFSPHDVDLTTTRVRLEAGGMLNITIRRNEEYSAEADPPVIRC